MKKKKWRYFLYIVNIYIIVFLSISLIFSLRALMQSYPEPAQNLLYYMESLFFHLLDFFLPSASPGIQAAFYCGSARKARGRKRELRYGCRFYFL